MANLSNIKRSITQLSFNACIDVIKNIRHRRETYRPKHMVKGKPKRLDDNTRKFKELIKNMTPEQLSKFMEGR